MEPGTETNDTIQFKFTCPECHLSGLTPEIRPDRAIGVSVGELRIRCPRCSGIVDVKTRVTAVEHAILAVETTAEYISRLIQKALNAELKRREAKEEPGMRPLASPTKAPSKAA
jgi:DNA-directed RNA polymerase subunit RPC12/RpoP